MKKVLFGAIISLALPLAAFAATPAKVPTCTITATPSTVKAGQPVTLKWTSSNATRAQLGLSQVSTSGTKIVRPIVGPWTYNLFVFGKGGIGECSTTVKVR